jgi:hypothetical protein
VLLVARTRGRVVEFERLECDFPTQGAGPQ